MRITERMMFNQVDLGMMNAQEQVVEAQDRVTTGKRILKLSDDPAGVGKVLNYRTTIANVEQYSRNINSVRQRLETTESPLVSAGNILQRLKELAVQQSSGSLTASDRANAAKETQQLFDEMVHLANTKTENGYIFAGYANDKAPFQSDGSITAGINISGEISIQIEGGTAIKANLTGDRVFKGVGGGIDIFSSINNFTTALNSNDTAGIQTAIGTMDSALAQVVNARADLGGRLNAIDYSRERLDEIKLAATKARSNEEDIDITRAISDFTAKQQALDAARASSASLLKMPTLMDFLK